MRPDLLPLFAELDHDDEDRVRAAIERIERERGELVDGDAAEASMRVARCVGHPSERVRKAVATASEKFTDDLFDAVLDVLGRDAHAFVQGEMRRVAERRARSNAAAKARMTRERAGSERLARIEELGGKEAKKLALEFAREEKAAFLLGLRHETSKVMLPLAFALDRTRDELEKPSRDWTEVVRHNEIARDRRALLSSIIDRAWEGAHAAAVPFRREPLAKIVTEAIEHLRLRMGPRADRLVATNTVPFDLELDLHKESLLQALQNVLQNAAEAYPAGGDAPIAVDVSAATERRGTVVVLSIADQGMGLPDSRREDPFRQFGSSKPNGSGLGLSIVRQKICGAHGGEVRLDSEKGSGTIVHLRLPAKQRRADGRRT